METEGPLPVQRRRYVAGRVEGAAVFFQNQGRGHAVLLEADKPSALILLKQAFFPQFPHNLIHILIVKALPGHKIKPHAEPIVDLLEFRQTYIDEPFPQLLSLRVSLLHFDEPLSGLILQSGVFVGLLMKTHVQPQQFVDSRFLQAGGVSPTEIGRDQLPELRPPITQVINPDTTVTQMRK
ncbi:hypothetical protein D1872_253340 [compost metagenome]